MVAKDGNSGFRGPAIDGILVNRDRRFLAQTPPNGPFAATGSLPPKDDIAEARMRWPKGYDGTRSATAIMGGWDPSLIER